MKRFLHLTYVFAISYGFNAIWELSQLGFYNVGENYRDHIGPCLIAAFWDAVIIIGIYLFLGLIHNNFTWERWWSATDTLITVFVTIGISTFIELRALNAGTWGYSEYMPLIPGLGTGILPTLQLCLTALAVFYIAKNRLTA